MNVLVTGHRGFVGSHFYREYQSKGHDVWGIDIKSGKDCRDFFRSEGQYREGYFDLVIHCAAVVGGRAKIEGNPLAIAQNLSIDSEMFNWAMKAKPKKILYFSSSAAYPISLQSHHLEHALEEPDIDLTAVKNPDQTYGWAKLTGEILAAQAQTEGQTVHVFRPFSGYGTDQDTSYPFPKFIQRAKAKEDPFTIWGDGLQTRDFIHIDDIVAAVREAVRLEIQGPINLGTGRATNFIQLAQMVTKAAGYKPTLEFMPGKPSGVAHRVADNTKLLEFYEPRVTLEEGIARAMADK